MNCQALYCRGSTQPEVTRVTPDLLISYVHNYQILLL